MEASDRVIGLHAQFTLEGFDKGLEEVKVQGLGLSDALARLRAHQG